MITGFRTETVQDVDAMWEADAAAEWERLNADDPNEEKLKNAAYELGNAREYMMDALDSIYEAAKEADGTDAYDKIMSLLNDLDDLKGEVYALKEELKGGHY